MPLAQSITPISIEDFLAGEAHSEVRHEYEDGLVYAMAGASVNHNLITGNVHRLLGNHLQDHDCTPFMSDMLIKTMQTRFRYPDVVVFCDNLTGDETLLANPVLIVEVLSRSTRQKDKGIKLTEYLALPSLQEYVLIEQDFVQVEVLRRRSGWRPANHYLGDEVVFESVDARLTVEAIYHKVNNNDMREWLAQKLPTQP